MTESVTRNINTTTLANVELNNLHDNRRTGNNYCGQST
jgi:hypothetical protein